MRSPLPLAGLAIFLACQADTPPPLEQTTNGCTPDILACASGDGCCPETCSPTSDNDCSRTCGNGVVDRGETCDPQDRCPQSCNDGNVCTTDVLFGSTANCNVACRHVPITTCAAGDGCCPTGCDNRSDSDCPPAPGTALLDRLRVSSTATPEGVIAGVSNFRIWGQGSLGTGPVYAVPYADCGSLIGYTTGTTTTPRARVARLDAQDRLVSTYDLGAFTLRGLAAEPDGHFAALLWDQTTNPKSLRVSRFDARGSAGWSSTLDDSLAAPTDFGIGESRLEFGGGRYGAYFHVHGISGFANGHEGDALHFVEASSGRRTLGWNWGCSHSMSELLRFSEAANQMLPICVTDCYPGTTGSNFATDAIGGLYLNHNQTKVRDFDAGCNGSVAAELGGAAPARNGWKLVFNGHQEPATLGQSSYNPATMNQDIGFVGIASDRSIDRITWLTTTPENEANASIASFRPTGDPAEQFVVGWSGSGGFKLARISAAGSFLEGPVGLANARWGERDDPFRTHLNGDVIWAWFDRPGSTMLKFARLRSGGTATCSPL
jgi:hypothetical protein